MTKTKKLKVGEENLERGFCWLKGPDEPLFPTYFLKIRGTEWLHLYFWMIKDLAWLQDWYYVGMVFGFLALIWSVYIFSKAVWSHNWREAVVATALFLWMLGNYIWMYSELHDWEFPNDRPIYDYYTIKSGYIFQSGMCVMAVYYLFVRPFKWSEPAEVSLRLYNETGLACPAPWCYFIDSIWYDFTWRDYENIHILFWLGKDTAWNLSNGYMWVAFGLLTVLEAIHFFLVTLTYKPLMIDNIHYLSQFVWVSSNLIWACGEIWHPTGYYDDPIQIGAPDGIVFPSYETLRWWASYVLLGGFVPIVLLYCVWVPGTLNGWGHMKYTEDHLPRHNGWAVPFDQDLLHDDDDDNDNDKYITTSKSATRIPDKTTHNNDEVENGDSNGVHNGIPDTGRSGEGFL